MDKTKVFGFNPQKIEKASIEELRKVAHIAGVTLKGKDKEAIAAQVVEIIAKVKGEAQKVVNDSKLSKSEKMRQLYGLGIQSAADISRILGTNYAFTFGVLKRMKDAPAKPQKVEKPAQEKEEKAAEKKDGKGKGEGK